MAAKSTASLQETRGSIFILDINIRDYTKRSGRILCLQQVLAASTAEEDQYKHINYAKWDKIQFTRLRSALSGRRPKTRGANSMTSMFTTGFQTHEYFKSRAEGEAA